MPDSLAFTLGEQAQCHLTSGDLAQAGLQFRHQMALNDLMAARFANDMDFLYQRVTSRGQLARVLSAQGEHGAARAVLDEARELALAAAAADKGNATAAPRIQQLRVISLQLRLAAGDLAAAQSEAHALLPELWPTATAACQRPRPGTACLRQPGPSCRHLAAAGPCTAGARAQRSPALMRAEQAAMLMQPARADDNNATRRWLQAQALGEQVRLWQPRGNAVRAQPLAAQALQSWQTAPAADGVPPALESWVQQARSPAQPPP